MPSSSRAIQELIGGSVENLTLAGGTYRLRRPSGPNGARAYHVASSISQWIAMPDATDLLPGTEFVIVVGAGSANLTIVDYGIGAIVPSAVANTVHRIILIEGGTVNGVWRARSSPVTIGAPIVISPTTEFYSFSILGSSNNVNLRQHLEAVFGYGGVNPVQITLLVPNAIVGSQFSDEAALDTGEFPAGSSLTISISQFGLIQARGGNGGTGGEVAGAAPTAGEDGKVAIRARIPTTIIGSGTIRGGGGGGGGGVPLSGLPGCGGGGGAGVPGGRGGTGPANPPIVTAGQNGQDGTDALGGAGGVWTGFPAAQTSGGAGGDPGSPGNPGGTTTIVGGAGGAAGKAIQHEISQVPNTSGFTGTIDGAIST